jgi:hypothetical protein
MVKWRTKMGNEDAKAKIRSNMEYCLLYKASSERRANVSHFITVLAVLSADAVREMLSMASVLFAASVVPMGCEHESEGLSTLTN